MPPSDTLPTRGVIVPLVTPLTASGAIDADSMSSLIEHVVGAGVDGVLVLGSTGENGGLAASDREAAVRAVVAAAGGRVHVMAGVAALGTNDAVHDGRRFAELGADSLLLSAPFVFSPSDTEMEIHFCRVADAVRIPVVAYDVPSRVRVALSPRLVARLAEAGVVSGVKDSSNDLGKPRLVAELTRSIPTFIRYTGSEEAIDALLLGSCHAAVPGLANVFPSLHVALARAAGEGDWDTAARRQREIIELLGLYAAPLAGASPTGAFFAAVKEALRQLGVIESATSTAPFVQADENVAQHVRATLERASALTA
jgi:4-hydroxy-tetrahydrodipicolinate synthase